MLRIAIVEDNPKDSAHLLSCLQRFAKANQMEIETEVFANALRFLQEYKGEFNVIFMDIDMPMMNGMEAARSLRKVDPHVVLIFVTALAKFALNGYEVDAFDFIVKPVQENFLSAKMKRVIKKLSSEQRVKVLIRSREKTVSVFADEIIYVDIYNHVLTFHTEQGNYETRGSMKDVTETLDGNNFVLCNKSYVVNLRHVQMVEGDDVIMTGGEKLPISRPRKKEFMQHIADYYSNKRTNMR